MAQVFQVVFTGTLNPATRAEEAVRDFAAVFKVSEEKARALIDAGEARVLKSDVDEANARHYLEVLEEIGLVARIEPMDAPAAEPTSPAAMASAAGQAAGSAVGTAAEPAPRSRADSSAASSPPSWPASGVTTSGMRPLSEPAARPAGHGWVWIEQAWAQFKQQPWNWLAAMALVYLVTGALGLVPVIGSLASMVLGPVFAGGLLLGARTQQRTGTLRSTTAFAGFSQRGGQLATVGVLYVAGLMVISLAAGLIAVATGVLTAGSMEALSSNDPTLIAAEIGPGLGLFLVLLMLGLVPLLMLYWFAPALVVLDGMTAVAAMRLSFQTCWKNLVPLTVYGLALLLLLVGGILVFALLTRLLGDLSETLMAVAMLLLIPLILLFAALTILSVFTAYLDVFDQGAIGHGTLAL